MSSTWPNCESTTCLEWSPQMVPNCDKSSASCSSLVYCSRGLHHHKTKVAFRLKNRQKCHFRVVFHRCRPTDLVVSGQSARSLVMAWPIGSDWDKRPMELSNPSSPSNAPRTPVAPVFFQRKIVNKKDSIKLWEKQQFKTATVNWSSQQTATAQPCQIWNNDLNEPQPQPALTAAVAGHRALQRTFGAKAKLVDATNNEDAPAAASWKLKKIKIKKKKKTFLGCGSTNTSSKSENMCIYIYIYSIQWPVYFNMDVHPWSLWFMIYAIHIYTSLFFSKRPVSFFHFRNASRSRRGRSASGPHCGAPPSSRARSVWAAISWPAAFAPAKLLKVSCFTTRFRSEKPEKNTRCRKVPSPVPCGAQSSLFGCFARHWPDLPKCKGSNRTLPLFLNVI